MPRRRAPSPRSILIRTKCWAGFWRSLGVRIVSVFMKQTTPRRIHTDELRAALEQVLSHYFEVRRRIKSLRRRRSVYSSSNTIENIEVELDRGQRVRMVLKDLSPAS